MGSRITLRLMFLLGLSASGMVFAFAGLREWQQVAHLEKELELRAGILSESLQEVIEPLVLADDGRRLTHLVNQFSGRPRLTGVAVYARDGQPLAVATVVPKKFRLLPTVARDAMEQDQKGGTFMQEGRQRWHLQAVPLHQREETVGALLLIHDASAIADQYAPFRRQNLIRLALYAFLMTLAALFVVRWTLLVPLARTVEWTRRIRTGERPEPRALPKRGLFAPLIREITRMANSLTVARNAAQEEARLRHAGESRWTPERLKEQIRTLLGGRPLLVIANREPYMHVREGRQIRYVVPASGLVTAVEPILRACGGTWIAHGSGDADRETVDSHSRLKVPPEEPLYILRRVWLSKEEEEGYYYGFSNEGLWPLCHIAHTRPTFRAKDWNSYVAVNAKFAEVLLEEIAEEEEPLVLIQDYHFALLPRMIREKRPDAKIAIFWHIPWPNPEAFGICPWARDLLEGMLGADLLGFHIQFHCNNFLDTVDRMLESRIDWEQFAIDRMGRTTWVKPFPISIAVQEIKPDLQAASALFSGAREKVTRELSLQAQWLGVGVDRIDYTKGIVERFRAVERFLEKHPSFQGKFTFLELAAPSRTLIKRYHDLETELETEAERINRRFQKNGWKPILLLKKHHSHEEIDFFYRAADLCLVTSLHDGMNLVAKEFVAARTDGEGVLILSQFAGASRELGDALLVNPYDIDQVAEAIHCALTMDQREEKNRMARMRETIQEHNVYQWAANLVAELAKLRRQGSPSLQKSVG